MDQVVVDLGDDHAEPGDTATVLGPGGAGEPTVAEWAAWAETLPHEVVTGIGPRVRRTTLPATPVAAAVPVTPDGTHVSATPVLRSLP